MPVVPKEKKKVAADYDGLIVTAASGFYYVCLVF